MRGRDRILLTVANHFCFVTQGIAVRRLQVVYLVGARAAGEECALGRAILCCVFF